MHYSLYIYYTGYIRLYINGALAIISTFKAQVGLPSTSYTHSRNSLYYLQSDPRVGPLQNYGLAGAVWIAGRAERLGRRLHRQ